MRCTALKKYRISNSFRIVINFKQVFDVKIESPSRYLLIQNQQ